MPVPLITYEAISAVYGQRFASLWFRPISLTHQD
ncbi:hypothetical protein C8N44_107151 [Allosediminivita pacifica]|uniref:Uncharacterized protein n=1 Tax=Allosediminivita pacifica TaxID=1267769 RepID=A0A2T6AZS7_9RHOB|nr:hypothetical protein C8N44_107151 [Allosediminivita pacifica]